MPILPLWLLVVLPLLSQQGEPSLESFLRRVRAARAASEAELRPRVEELLRRLDENQSTRSPSIENRIVGEIVALGAESAPLFLPHLDPGEQPLDADRYRAQVLAGALASLSASILTDDLVELARTASPQGRRLAIFVLGSAPPTDQPRVARFLEAEFQVAGTPAQRLALMRSLARLGQSPALLRSALGDSQPDLVRTALTAMTAAKDQAGAPQVLDLVRSPGAPDTLLPELTEYFLASPGTLDPDGLDDLLALAQRESIDIRARVALLEAVPRLTDQLSTRLRRRLEDLSKGPNADLREATLIVMASMGDKSAARELLRPYDQAVDRDDQRPESFEARADVYLRLGEYRDAIRDYKRALELLGQRSRQRSRVDLWSNLARAYVLSRNLSRAFSTLEDFGLNLSQKEGLRADPDFAPLLEHRTYRKALE